MNINELISEIFSYGELNSITESLDPMLESLSDDVRTWFRADPNRLSMKKKLAFDQFLNDYPQYQNTNRVSTDSVFGKKRKELLVQPVDPTTNTIAVPVKAETNSSKIINWIKAHPTEKFAAFCLENKDMDTPSNRTIFNKARVALGFKQKAPVPTSVEVEDEVADTESGIPEEEDDSTSTSTTGKLLVSDFKGSPISTRTFIIHPTNNSLPEFNGSKGKPITIYPRDLISGTELLKIRYYLTDTFGLTRDQENEFITNLIYDKKWAHQLDKDTQFDIIRDAVNGDKTAIKFLFLCCYQNIAYNYTAGPTPYIGGKLASHRPVTDDDKTTYIGICYQTLAGNFNPKSDESGSSLHPKKGPLTCEDLLGTNDYPLINFGTRYSQLLQSAIREQFKIEKASGITGKAAVSNKTANTFRYVAAKWKSDNKSTDWDEFVKDNPYAEWVSFFPGPLTTDHSIDNSKYTDIDQINRRKLAFMKAYVEDLQTVSYEVTAANMDMDSDKSTDYGAFATEDKHEQLSAEFLQDLNDMIHDDEYTDNVDILLQHVLTELQAAEDFRTTNSGDDKYEEKPLPLTTSKAQTAKGTLGKLFSRYDIEYSTFMSCVNDLSPQLVLNYIRKHK